LLLACKSDKSSNTNYHGTQEISVAPNNEVLSKLNEGDGNFKINSKILEDAVKTNLEAGYPEKAMDLMQNVLFHFGQGADAKEYGALTLNLFKGVEATEIIYQGLLSGFQSKYPNHEVSLNAKTHISVLDLIEEKGKQITEEGSNRFNVQAAKEYIQISESYMLINPENKVAAEQLLKAANLAKSIPAYATKAVALYDWFILKHPDHPKAGQALFLKAFTYDNDLNDDDKARALYTEFLEKYPRDDFADDAAMLIQNLGKSDEELFEAITNQKN
jgi:tetratricopeptide (TPR) repeat protein